MMSDSSYCSTETESIASFGAVNFDQIVDEVAAREEVSAQGTARKKQKPEHKLRAVLPSNLHTIMWMDKHITKCLYGQDYKYSGPAHAEGSSPEVGKEASWG
jgi:hypothetical protein